jgi:hypothetical protein
MKLHCEMQGFRGTENKFMVLGDAVPPYLVSRWRKQVSQEHCRLSTRVNVIT